MSGFNFSPFGLPLGSMPNTFDPFPGNAMYTTQSSPIQPTFTSWSGTPGWQDFNVHNSGYGAPNQAQTPGSNGYFANKQQDYVPFDDGEDFYGNEDKEKVVHEEKMRTFGHNQGIPGQYVQSISGGAGPPRPHHGDNDLAALATFKAAHLQHEGLATSAAQSTTQKPSADAAEHMAQLRAKLKAQQRQKSATPTPTKDNKKPDKLNNEDSWEAAKQEIEERRPGKHVQKATETVSFRPAAKPRADDKSFTASQSSAFIPPTSHADIEGLFAEVKAGMSGKPALEATSIRKGESEGVGPKLPRATTSKAKAVDNDKQRPNPGAKTPSSEASELGEIREDAPESCSAREAPEPVSPKNNRFPIANVDKKHQANGKFVQLAKDPTNNANSQDSPPFRPTNTPNAAYAGANVQKGGQQTQQNHDRSQMNRSFQSSDKNNETNSYQSYQPRGSEDLSRRQTQGSRDYPNGSERTTFDQDRRYRDRDQQGPRSTESGNNSAVAQYSGSSENARSEAHGVEAQSAGSADHAGKSSLVPKTPITKTFNTVQTPISKDGVDVPISSEASGATENPSLDLVHSLQPSMFANQQMYEDILDWLEITQWSDVPARTKKLARHRKLKALDIQRAELEQEAQQELEEQSRSLRARSTLPAEPGTLRGVFSPQVLRAASGTKMAPPPLPLKDSEDMGIKIKNLANSEVQATGGITETKQSSVSPTNTQGGASTTGAKRSRVDDLESNQIDRVSKLPRVDANHRFEDSKALTSPVIKNESLESRITRNDGPRSATYNRRSRSPDRRRRSPSPTFRRASDSVPYFSRSRDGQTTRNGRYSPQFSRHGSPSRRDSDLRGGHLYRESPRFDRDLESRVQYDRDPDFQSNYRGRGGARGRSNNYRGSYTSRGSRGGFNGRANGSESLNLKNGDARYFMIKSWNAENVEIAQRDGTWATQKKNLDTLTEAYNNCRHVVLFFSVNNSKAFQGYARMSSAPGTAPTPSWAKQLIWESTPPFFIDWIATNETRFNRCGHLKNSLNEGQAVLVGRDGQEIEEHCGRGLCELIDSMGGYGYVGEGGWGRDPSPEV